MPPEELTPGEASIQRAVARTGLSRDQVVSRRRSGPRVDGRDVLRPGALALLSERASEAESVLARMGAIVGEPGAREQLGVAIRAIRRAVEIEHGAGGADGAQANT